ncbi:MAG: ATPase [Candidatus Symbiothrix sp.]|jgi:N-acetylglucosamine kinase-like BadF-type ATPase|nr:ATPase [Candidatus Symbiothrix sp.]
MILIADSGSTKTNWSFISANGEVQTGVTSGINPFFLTEEEIVDLLKKEFIFPEEAISSVYFYGAGCTPEKAPVVSEALNAYFQPEKMEVHSDLLAAARSLCLNEAGIACILGTGSNSGQYDGEKIIQQVSPLGYILGDEGSGAVLGKKLIGDMLKNQLSPHIVQDFQYTYHLNPAQIMDHVYRRPFPNRFLAQFVPFISNHIIDSEIKQLVEDSFTEFIRRNILQYPESNQLPVHFTGGVAFGFKNNLENVFSKFNLQLGKITKDPMQGLIDYHIRIRN